MPAATPTILTGTNGVSTVTINGLDYQCVLGNWRASATKRYTEQTTFCSGGWVVETSGMKQVVGSATGFMSTGDDISDPMLDFEAQDGVPIVLQADTAKTISFTGHIEKDFGVNAASNSEFGIRFRSKGAVGSTGFTT